MNIDIRNERHEDHRAVEELTREAFWNLYVPGCDEHYLVHIMRNHPDFIPTLDFVAVLDDKIVGNIMYTKSYVIDRDNNRLETITFGPVSVLPEYQRKGIGSALIRHSSDIAHQNGFKAIIIEGHPYNSLIPIISIVCPKCICAYFNQQIESDFCTEGEGADDGSHPKNRWPSQNPLRYPSYGINTLIRQSRNRLLDVRLVGSSKRKTIMAPVNLTSCTYLPSKS
ncbi:MAG: GNAT family N-acetyltransferase [Chitinivibrionales bacterium]